MTDPLDDTSIVDADSPMAEEMVAAGRVFLEACARMSEKIRHQDESAETVRQNALGHALQTAMSLSIRDGMTTETEAFPMVASFVGWFAHHQSLCEGGEFLSKLFGASVTGLEMARRATLNGLNTKGEC